MKVHVPMQKNAARRETGRGGPRLCAEYQDFIGSLCDGAFVLHEGRIVLANEALSRMTGFANMEIKRMAPDELAVPEDRERIARLCAEVLSTSGVSGRIGFSLARTGLPAEMALAPAGHGAAVFLGVVTGGPERTIEKGIREMCHDLNTQLMHIINAKDGMAEDLATLLSLADGTEAARSRAWMDARESLETYRAGLDHACRRITAATKAFSVLFSAATAGRPRD